MNVLNFTALIDADLTIQSAEDARAIFVRDITAFAPIAVPHLTGGKPRNGSAEQKIMSDIADGYAAKGLNKTAWTSARTRLLNTMRIICVNPRVAIETDAEYAVRVMEARTVANVGTKEALLAAIAGKGAQATAAAKAKRAQAATNAANRKAEADAAKDPKAAAAKAKAEAEQAAKDAKAAKEAAKVDPEAAKAERAVVVESNLTQSPKTLRALAKAYADGEIDPARWATFIADMAYALDAAKATHAPVVEGTTEAPAKAKRTRKAKVA